MQYFTFIFALLVIFTIKQIDSEDYKIVCYFANWSSTKPDKGKFTVDNIDPNLCTHVIYSFATLDENTLKISMQDPNVDTGK